MIIEREIPKLENLERALLDRGTPDERWEWRIKGSDIKHHPTKPAVQYTNGDQTWYWIGKVHRWDGPAQYMNWEYQYWIWGEPLSRENWLRDPRRLDWLRGRLSAL